MHKKVGFLHFGVIAKTKRNLLFKLTTMIFLTVQLYKFTIQNDKFKVIFREKGYNIFTFSIGSAPFF